MNYGQSLVAAAKLVLSGHANGVGGDAPGNFHELGVMAKLKPHQIDGVSWLIRRYVTGVNVILGDEMGLGKTLQTITFLCYLKEHKSSGPFLILCPLSVVDSWVSEMTNFAPKLRVLSYVGDKEHRRSMRRIAHEHVKMQSSLPNVCNLDAPKKLSFLPFDVLLTTYDVALADQDFLSQIPWHYAVIDEAQRLKNPSTVFYNVLQEKFIIPRRLLITGTPIQNNLSELWALLHFCMPLVFGTLKQFLFTFNDVADPPSGKVASEVRQQFGILKYILEAFMLRRTKSQLIECGTLMLPPLTEISVMVPLSPLQNKVYASILRNELPQLLALASGGSNNHSLQNIVMQLRKACSHPYLFPGIEPEPYNEGEHLIQASGKLIVLDKLLQKLKNSGHRVLLFAQMTTTLDIIQDFMELRKYSYVRLDGSIRAEERFAAIRSFSRHLSVDDSSSTEDPHCAFVFLISTRAGGVGLNLVAADTVIFYEQDWNPQVDKQALQRAHRIGQMNHVLSINLVSEHSVEEVIMRRAEKKLQLSKNVVGENCMNQNLNEMEGTEGGIFQSIVFGLHTFDPSKVNDAKSAELKLLESGAIAEKVISIRHHQQTGKDERSFEVSPMNCLIGFEQATKKCSDSLKLEPHIDEASYLSWVKEFENTKLSHDPVLWPSSQKILPVGKHLENDAKKAEEKKLAKWEAIGYHSFSVKNPSCIVDLKMMSDLGSVNFVYGDCTQPSKVCPSEPTIILSCVDDSGRWGHGGMFDALVKLSPSVCTAYERASEFKDLHLGDLHLINITEASSDVEGKDAAFAQFVGLAVVQSYNARRKISRSKISISDLECCLSKASFSAAQTSASIHMPRIGYQEGSDRSEWYTVERLIRKYSSLYAVNIFVYYFRRL